MSLVTEYSRGSRWMLGAALLSYQNICNSGKHGSIGRYDDRIMVMVELIISLTRESVRYFPVGNYRTVDFCPVSRVPRGGLHVFPHCKVRNCLLSLLVALE